MATYIIEYTTLDKEGNSIMYWGKIKVKNKSSEFDAKTSLEKHLKHKNTNVDKLIIHSCRKDYEMKGDMFSFLNNIVNGKG
jgi:hypothetical protein